VPGVPENIPHQAKKTDSVMGEMKRSGKLLPILLGAAAGMLAARLMLPASTPPIGRKRKTAGSIASLEKVRIGGTDQWILIRSEDVVNNPILLILHGGPGTAELALNRANTRALERYFTVVNWDQRGAGKSYKAIGDKSKMTIDQFIEDTRELSQYLLKRFGKERIVLQGRSWGSALGMLAVSKYPELFYAYVGIGQISDMEEGEKASYDWTMYMARTNGDIKGLRKLQRMGPPPYTGDWLTKFMDQRKLVCRYGGEVCGNSNGGNGLITGSLLFSPEYSLTDILMYYRSAIESLRLVHPQLMKVNLFETAPAVKVPVIFMEGRHDHVVPASLAARYYEVLEAPGKELIWFEDSAHMPDIEEPKRYYQAMIEKVLPLVTGRSSFQQPQPEAFTSLNTDR
jgi:pimeloyl-ACP methyl ester carboxylesterase